MKQNVAIFGLLGILGGLLAALADVFITWPMEGASFFFRHPFEVTLQTTGELLAAREGFQLLGSHLFSAVGIPLQVFGLWMLFRMVKKEYPKTAKSTLFFGVSGLAGGLLYHQSLTYLGLSVKLNGSPTQTAALFSPFIDPFGLLFLLGFTGVSILYVAAVIAKKTVLPRAAAWCNPLSMWLLFAGFSVVLPAPARTVFIYTFYNLATAFTFLGILIIYRYKIRRERDR